MPDDVEDRGVAVLQLEDGDRALLALAVEEPVEVRGGVLHVVAADVGDPALGAAPRDHAREREALLRVGQLAPDPRGLLGVRGVLDRGPVQPRVGELLLVGPLADAQLGLHQQHLEEHVVVGDVVLPGDAALLPLVEPVGDGRAVAGLAAELRRERAELLDAGAGGQEPLFVGVARRLALDRLDDPEERLGLGVAVAARTRGRRTARTPA